jgi:RND family efflux transporter MFP subunit
MKQKKLFKIVLGVLIVGILGAAGWWLWQHNRRTAAVTELFELYTKVRVTRMDLSDKIDGTGTVTLEKNSALYPAYAGTVTQILVKSGDSVRKGQLLMVLQSDTLETDWAEINSTLVQAQNNLKLAQKTLERQRELYKIQGTTIDDVESAEADVQQYQETIKLNRIKLSILTRKEDGANFMAANHRDIQIRAPFDASIAWIDVKLGETVATDTQLLSLGGENAIQVQVDVDQTDISMVKTGLKAIITANDQNSTSIPGVVSSFGSIGTTTSGVVTFPTMISIAKPDRRKMSDSTGSAKPTGVSAPSGATGRPGISGSAALTAAGRGQHTGPRFRKGADLVTDIGSLLKSGMTVDVTILVNSHPDVLAVPMRAITESDGQGTVKVWREKTKSYVTRKVVVGFKGSTHAEVTKGLSEGEQIGVPRVAPGSQNGRSSQSRQNRNRMMGGGPMGGPSSMGRRVRKP